MSVGRVCITMCKIENVLRLFRPKASVVRLSLPELVMQLRTALCFCHGISTKPTKLNWMSTILAIVR